MNEGFDAIIDAALEQLVADKTKQLRAQLDAANADRAILKGALQGLTMWLSRWRHAMTIRAIGAEQAWNELERLHNDGAALASSDAAQWLRERERRVAEKVWRSCVSSRELEAALGASGRTIEQMMARSLDALLKEET